MVLPDPEVPLPEAPIVLPEPVEDEEPLALGVVVELLLGVEPEAPIVPVLLGVVLVLALGVLLVLVLGVLLLGVVLGELAFGAFVAAPEPVLPEAPIVEPEPLRVLSAPEAPVPVALPLEPAAAPVPLPPDAPAAPPEDCATA